MTIAPAFGALFKQNPTPQKSDSLAHWDLLIVLSRQSTPCA